jgi:hypothetical protein
MMHTHGSAPRFCGDGRAPEKLRQPDPPATSPLVSHGEASAMTHSPVPEQLQQHRARIVPLLHPVTRSISLSPMPSSLSAESRTPRLLLLCER